MNCKNKGMYNKLYLENNITDLHLLAGKEYRCDDDIKDGTLLRNNVMV